MIHDVIFTHGEKFGNMIQVLLVDAPGITTTHVYISKKIQITLDPKMIVVLFTILQTYREISMSNLLITL